MGVGQAIPSPGQFVGTIDSSLRGMHGRDYLLSSVMRQHRSLVAVISSLRENATILSLGAGGAFVEEYLVRGFGASVTIVDFPETIELNRMLYDRLFDKQVPLDLASDPLDFGKELYDGVFWFDNIEHLPRNPAEVFSPIAKSLRAGGWMFLTTDNICRLVNIGKLLMGRNILPPPSRMFASVNFENEGVHRREYNAAEILSLLSACGFTNQKVQYFWQKPRDSIQKLPLWIIELLIPKLRPHMLISARKAQPEARAN